MIWKNIPIPESIVIPLAIGIALEIFFSRPLFPSKIVWVVLAVILFLLGLILMGWSVQVAGLLDMASPGELITAGPYSVSRNPMYVSWVFIYLSVFFVSRSLWVLLLFPIAILLTHFGAVLPEEKVLLEKFGDTFVEYCEKARRYF